ncbi:hypothetical protein COO60DRAFT_1623914 [Scenedesmus sp. NREL 46B-D3]|nr:hypothetical protein COO60DRAFT_1623914 [Scenedesmus sp. NREL 46B-D3]
MKEQHGDLIDASGPTDLLADLGESIYVQVVKCMTQGHSWSSLLSAIVGLVATVLLQVALLVLIMLSAGDAFPTKRALWRPDHIEGGIAVFLVTLLALCVLALYVLQEARCACKLGYMVAVYGCFMPGCWLLPEHNSAEVRANKQLVIQSELQASPGKAIVAAMVPLVQLLVALLCFVCGAWVMATFKTADVAGILINSVGIVFILELDDKFGDLFNWGETTATRAGGCVAVERAGGCRAAWGAVYRWLLLLVMACIVSAILLSPMLVLRVNLVRVVPASDNNALRIFGASAGILLAMLLVLSDMVWYHPLTSTSSAKQAAIAIGYMFVLSMVSSIGTAVMFAQHAPKPPPSPDSGPCAHGATCSSGPGRSGSTLAGPVLVGVLILIAVLAAWVLPSYRKRKTAEVSGAPCCRTEPLPELEARATGAVVVMESVA